MSVSPKILKAHGCDPKLWKELFVAENTEKRREIKKLELLIQNRICDGQLRCIAEYRTWAAIDMAYDVPFAQTAPTIINTLLGRKWEKTEEVLAELERWGLKEEELFLRMTGENGQTIKVLNPPTFYKILVPLVKAYVTIRWAKLFNERNLNPLLKYEPMQPNAEHRIMCEILTYLVQVITADYGYANVLKDTIFQTLMYATCLSFPTEVWNREKQLEEGEDGEEKEVIQKEGIRYNLPHPSRMFWDLSYPISTFNTNTGCEFAGYWKVISYGEVLDNPNYWNRRQVSYSGDRWSDPLTTGYLKEFFPCVMTFPVPPTISGQGTNRENNLLFYTTAERDMAVSLTDLYMRIVPSRYKLGTYKYPIWVRFVVASDNTVVYAEPCCYNPVLYSGYDANGLRSKNSSMALEVLPFQDIVGNTLSQILLTAKQNLTSLNFYDKNQIDSRQVDDLKNRGQMLLQSMNWLPFDSLKVSRSGVDPEKAVVKVGFEKQDLTPMFQSLNTTLAMLERLLQLSAQESGSAASHQQSKAEIDQIGNSTSNRVQFTGSFIDDFIDAWKRQLADASIAYLSDPVRAMVPSDMPDIEASLKTLGFETDSVVKGEGRLMVKGKKRSIKIDQIATSSKGPERKNDAQVAQVMMNSVMSLAKNQKIMEAIGIKPILKLMEKAAILAGADKDFRLRPDKQAEVDALQKMAEQIQIAAAKHVEETVAKPAAEQMAKMQAEIAGLDQAMQKLIQSLGLAKPAGQPAATQPPPPNAPQTPPQPVNAAPAGQPQQVPVQ